MKNHDDFEKKESFEKFVINLIEYYEEAEKLLYFLYLSDNERDKYTRQLKVVKSYIKKMKRCTSIEEAKKYVKLNKLIKERG